MSHPPASERGVAMLLTVALIIIVAALVLSGTGELRALDELSRAEFAGEAQAYSVTQAGLVDAYAWFRRQPVQPVADFSPQLDPGADPPINETEDPAQGLVRTFEISPGLWGRYTVLPLHPADSFEDANANGIFDEGEMFTDTDGDGRRTPARGTRDVTAERGLPGAGTVWRIECLGQVFQRPRADLPLGEGPNRAVGSALLATEIQRLPLSPPISGAAYCSRGDQTFLRKRARVRAPVTALGYPPSTGAPTISTDSEISGAYTAAPVAGDQMVDVFGANLTDLQSMADISTKDEASLPDELPPYSLVVVDGNLEYSSTERLRGSGVLIVTGDLIIESGSHSYYTGVVYVGGDFTLSAPAFVRGQVIVRGTLTLEGGQGDFIELEHDPELITHLMSKMGHYRYARAFFRPLPHHADGRPDRAFENRSGRSVLSEEVAKAVAASPPPPDPGPPTGLPTDYRAHDTDHPELVQALDEMNWIIGADPGSPLADKVEDAFTAAHAALDALVAALPDPAAADAALATAITEISVAVSDNGLDPIEGQAIIDLLEAVNTGS